jgi:hypothetical protein
LKDSLGDVFYASIKEAFQDKEPIAYNEISEEQRQILGTMLFLEIFYSVLKACSQSLPLQNFDAGVLYVTRSNNNERLTRRNFPSDQNIEQYSNMELVNINLIFPQSTQGYSIGISILNNFGYHFPMVAPR